MYDDVAKKVSSKKEERIWGEVNLGRATNGNGE